MGALLSGLPQTLVLAGGFKPLHIITIAMALIAPQIGRLWGFS